MNPRCGSFRPYPAIAPALLACLGLQLAAPGRADAAPPALHVAGNTLVDSAGATVVLRGVNVPSLETLNTGEGPAPGSSTGLMASVNEVINHWHVNLIRLPICQDRWEGRAPVDYHGFPNSADAYRNIVDQVVSTSSAAGVYVLVDMHWSDAGVWGRNIAQHAMPDDNTATAWAGVAARYANNPAVLFDAYNEPYPKTWSQWLRGGVITEGAASYHSPGMQGIVDTIRATGANNIIVVGGIQYAGDLRGFVTGYAISGANLMFSAHVYPFGDVNWDEKYTVAAKLGPILVGEFGADTADDYADFYARILPWIERNKYSSTAWSFNPTYRPVVISDWEFHRTFFAGRYVFSALTGGPGFPTGLLASGGGGGIHLTWKGVPGAASYSVFRADRPNGEGSNPAVATGITGTSTTDTGVIAGLRYYYQVVAVNAAGVSGPSNESGAIAGSPGTIRAIYDGGLESGYYNYSYGAKVALPATAMEPGAGASAAHGGPRWASVVFSAGGQGLQFRASEFDSSPYDTLTFLINGGPAGGQVIRVHGDLGGAKGAASVKIGPLAQNKWTRVNIPFNALGIARAANLDGFRFENPDGAEPVFYLDGMYITGGRGHESALGQ
jgi:hypothetical protein